jgi:regulator of sirC expression with transglutaminase-like and TPR domain
MQPPRIRFTPVPLKARHDGWTAARQIHFIEVLSATKSISKACRAVGMSRMSAYTLRDRPDARQFLLAWSAALRPDFEFSQRAADRAGSIKRSARAKPDEVKETEDPGSLLTTVKAKSSALQTLQTYLAELRAQEQRLGSAQ